MLDIEVRFFENSDSYNPGSKQRVTGKEYSYQSFAAVQEGDVVIVPTYGDKYPNLRLTFAQVSRVRPTIGEPNPSLRYVIQKVDISAYEALIAQQRDRETALRMLKVARVRRERVEEFKDVKPFLTGDEEGFIRKTLEFEFDEVSVGDEAASVA